MILKLKNTHIILIILLTGSLQVFSQNVKLRIDAPKEALVATNFKIKFVIESNEVIADNPEITDIKGLDILYGPSVFNTTNLTTNKDGEKEVKYAVAYNYIVVAPKSGKITIPKFEIEFDGKRYQSEVATIKILNLPNEVNKNIAKDIDDNEKKKNKIRKIVDDTKIEAFVKTIPSKARVNPSDTLSVTYKLYTTNQDFKVAYLNLPSSRMFYQQNYRPNSEQGQLETIKGVKYYVFDIYKTILQPRDTGSITMNDGDIKLVYYIKTRQKMKNYSGEEYDVVGEKEIDLKIEGISVSVFELTEI